MSMSESVKTGKSSVSDGVTYDLEAVRARSYHLEVVVEEARKKCETL